MATEILLNQREINHNPKWFYGLISVLIESSLIETQEQREN